MTNHPKLTAARQDDPLCVICNYPLIHWRHVDREGHDFRAAEPKEWCPECCTESGETLYGICTNKFHDEKEGCDD